MSAMFAHDTGIEFAAQAGPGAPVWRGRAASGEDLLAFARWARRTDGGSSWSKRSTSPGL